MTAPAQPDPAAPATGAPAQDTAPAPAGDTTDWQAETTKWKALARKHEADSRKLQQLEEAQKTEQQKTADRAERAERERDEARLDVVRRDVAAAKGLPPSMAGRLRGTTKEEIEADAAELAKELKPAAAVDRRTGRPVEDLKPGALPAGQPSAVDMDAWMRGRASR